MNRIGQNSGTRWFGLHISTAFFGYLQRGSRLFWHSHFKQYVVPECIYQSFLPFSKRFQRNETCDLFITYSKLRNKKYYYVFFDPCRCSLRWKKAHYVLTEFHRAIDQERSRNFTSHHSKPAFNNLYFNFHLTESIVPRLVLRIQFENCKAWRCSVRTRNWTTSNYPVLTIFNTNKYIDDGCHEIWSTVGLRILLWLVYGFPIQPSTINKASFIVKGLYHSRQRLHFFMLFWTPAGGNIWTPSEGRASVQYTAFRYVLRKGNFWVCALQTKLDISCKNHLV